MAASERRVIEIVIDGQQGEISARKLDAGLAKIDRTIDPLSVKTRQYNQSIAYLKAGLDSGALSADQHARKIEGLGRAYEDSRRRIEANTRQMQTSNTTTEQSGSAFSGLATRATAAIAAIVAVAYAAKETAEKIATAGDQVRTMTARLNVLTFAADGSKEAFERVFQLAQRTGTSLDDTAASFSTLAIAAGDFGASTKDIERATEAIIKLGRIGGSSADQVKTVLQQLGQGIASGTFQGDELRSVRENGALVARAIAKEFGVTVGELKKLGEEGKLTGQRVLKSLVDAASGADAAFKKLPPTMEQAGQRSANAWKLLGAAIDESTGLSRLLSAGMTAAADRVELLARRISGDILTAIRKVNFEIGELEARDAAAWSRRNRDQAAIDDRGPVPDSIAPHIASRGGPAAIPSNRALEAAKAERERLATIAFNEAQNQGFEQARQNREQQERARVKGTADAATRLREIEEKANPAAKATREYNEAVKKLKSDLELGYTTQEKFNRGMAAAQTILSSVGSGAKQAAKSIEALSEALAAADFSGKLAEAAYDGAKALMAIEAQAEAAKKAMDVFDGKRNAAFEEKYGAALLRDKENKATRDFRESTTSIERENTLLQRQLELVGQRPEIIDREIALLKVKLDLESRGATMSEVDIQRRVEAMTVQERLTRETQESSRAAELWAEPMKNAIASVQSAFTEFFESVMEKGVHSFTDLANSFQKIYRRMIAEQLSLAVMQSFQPGAAGRSGGGGQSGGMMGGVGDTLGWIMRGIQGLGGSSSGGVSSFSSGFASEHTGTALTSAASGGGGGGALGGLFSMFGGGGGGGGGFSLSSLFGGGGGGVDAMGNAGIGGGAFGGGGMSMGGMFMGGMGAISGIMSAMKADSTVGKIGGGMQAAGSIIGMIPTPWTKAIGMGLQIIGSILPMFAPPKDVSSASVGMYNPETGKYGSRVAFAHTVTAPEAPEIGNSVLATLKEFGGSVAAGRNAPNYYVWQGDSPYGKGRFDTGITENNYFGKLAETFVNGGTPNTVFTRSDGKLAAGGGRDVDYMNTMAKRAIWTPEGTTPLPFEYTTTDSAGVMKQLAVLLMKLGLAEGSFTGLSGTSSTIVRNFTEADPDKLGQAMAWGRDTYDVLNRADVMTEAETAFTDLNKTFKDAITLAKEYKLATEGLVASQRRALNSYATDFQQAIDDRIMGIEDPTKLQQTQLDREFDQVRKEAAYLNEQYARGLTDTLININSIEKAYGLERERIVNAQIESALASMESFERRLRFGDLSAANPLETLAGTLGTFRANAAQAMAGDATAMGRYESFGTAAITAQMAYSGNNYDTAALREEMLRQIALMQGSGAGAVANSNEIVLALEEQNRLMQQLLDRLQAA